MPSRDKDHIIRSPSFKTKLSSITGVNSEEKALIIRIGNLIDFLTQEQLQESNPNIKSKKFSNLVPVPQNVSTTVLDGGFTIKWDPVDFSGFSFYEVQIDSSTVFPDPRIFEIIDTKFTLKEDIGSSLYIRIRTVSKRGLVSAFTSTETITVVDSDIAVDSDQRDFENRTSVLTKPLLQGSELDVITGDSILVGVGGIVAGSPLTQEDRHEGFPNNSNRINEITYDLIEHSNSCNSFQEKIVGIPDDFIEQSDFYLFEVPGTSGQAFYYSTFIYPSSFIDFFDITDLSTDPSTIDIEFLRYRSESFYFPNYPQSGIILSAWNSIFKI